MNLRHLLIFKTVVDTGSFTKAANNYLLRNLEYRMRLGN